MKRSKADVAICIFLTVFYICTLVFAYNMNKPTDTRSLAEIQLSEYLRQQKSEG